MIDNFGGHTIYINMTFRTEVKILCGQNNDNEKRYRQ